MCFLSLFHFSSLKKPFFFLFASTFSGWELVLPSRGWGRPSWGWPFLLRVGVGPSFFALFNLHLTMFPLIFDASWTISTPKRKGKARTWPKGEEEKTTKGEDGEGQAPSQKGRGGRGEAQS